MRSFKSWTISCKLVAVVTVAVSSAVLISSLASAWREADRQFEAKYGELHGIAVALAATVSESLNTGDRRRIANTLKGVGAIPGISYVQVRDRKGVSAFQFGAGVILRRENTEPANATTDNATTDQGSFAPNLSTFAVTVPIVHAGSPIGALHMIADISDLREALIYSVIAALAVGSCCIVFGIVLALRLRRTITGPIAALTRAMHEVSQTKRFDQTVPRPNDDEIGVMVDAFNDMLAEIRYRDQSLATHRDRLEHEVAERTVALAAAHQAAERASAAKSDFLATMSHEIRTPMNSMLVMGELLATCDLSARARRCSDVILTSGKMLLSIVNDVLDLAKFEAGQLRLESIELDVRRTVEDVLQLYAEQANKLELELAGYVAPDAPIKIASDPVRLKQLLSNLVSNALKFTSRGGVLVRVAVADGGAQDGTKTTLRFSVADTGIGIPSDKLPVIFDAFTQAEQSTTRQFGGTGIGLTICRRLVSAMGGRIFVDSELNHGSTFAFELPVDIVEHAAAIAHPVDPPRPALVLLPQGPNRSVLCDHMADLGYQAITDLSQLTPTAKAKLRFVLTTPTRLPELPEALLPPRCPRLVLSRFGDSNADALIAEGKAHGILHTPAGTAANVEILSQARDGLAGLQRVFTPIVPNAEPRTTAAQTFPGVHVLAADDSAINREVLEEVLRRLEVTVTSVEDGAEAVAAVKSGRFDLVFMDGSMPVMDGFDAARAIRAWEAAHDRNPVPIIALSGHVTADVAAAWRRAGMQDFISKPFTLQAISTCLAQWLSPRQAPRPEHQPTIDADWTASAGAVEGPAPLIDLLVLRSLGQNQGCASPIVGRVIALYEQHAPHALEKIRSAARSDDPACLASAAHALNSMSRNIGAKRVSALCQSIETAARDGQLWAPDTDRIAQLDRDLTDTVQQLRRLQRAPVPERL